MDRPSTRAAPRWCRPVSRSRCTRLGGAWLFGEVSDPGRTTGASDIEFLRFSDHGHYVSGSNDGGMRHLESDKFTIGGEATATAGPIGRDASAETDAMMHAEMLSYSRSRGLFAGISLEGATLRPDAETNRELSGRDVTNHEILSGAVKASAIASKFEMALNRQSPNRSR